MVCYEWEAGIVNYCWEEGGRESLLQPAVHSQHCQPVAKYSTCVYFHCLVIPCYHCLFPAAALLLHIYWRIPACHQHHDSAILMYIWRGCVTVTVTTLFRTTAWSETWRKDGE